MLTSAAARLSDGAGRFLSCRTRCGRLLIMVKKKTTKHSWTSPRTQRAIIADRASGLSCREIGKKYDVDSSTVSRICRRFREESPESELAKDPVADYRSRLKTKSIRAIDAGLDDQSDNYKRGHLGVSVMKGIGEFEIDRGVHVTIEERARHLPPEWQARYMVGPAMLEEANAIDVRAEEVQESKSDSASQEPPDAAG
jgi:hypothetical protein